VETAPLKTALTLFMAITCAACSPLYLDWQNGTVRTTPPIEETTNAQLPNTSSSAARSQTAAVPRKHKPMANPETEEMSIEPEAAKPPPPPATSTISMVAPGDTSEVAERSLDATSHRLAHFDRANLSGPSLTAFDQANAFLTQGRQAITERDYVAASGFAQKASALAAQLQTTSSAR